MKIKKTVALIISLLGIGILGTSFYYKHKLNQAKEGVNSLLSPLASNPFGEYIGSDAKHKLRGYEIKIHLLMAFGAILTACGVSYYVYIKQK
jgi:hypothetical protein